MPLVCQIKQGDWHSVELAIRQIMRQLGPQAEAYFSELVLEKIMPNRLLSTDASSRVTATNLASWVSEGDGIEIEDNGDGTITISVDEEALVGVGIEEVADAQERVQSDARVIYQKDIQKLYLRRT